MKNWPEWTHIVLSLKPGYYAGSDWLFGERRCTLPAPIRDDRWEKRERSGPSRWNEACKLAAIPCNPILGKCTCNQFVICYLWAPGVRPSSLCQRGAGGEKVLARRRTGSKEGWEPTGLPWFQYSTPSSGFKFPLRKKPFQEWNVDSTKKKTVKKEALHSH